MKAIVRFFNSFCRPAAVILIVCGSSFVSGCSDAGDILDLALNPPERKEIDTSIMGVNNFFVDREFGSIPEQFTEIRDTLGLPRVRILLAWLTDVQPSPAVAPNYGFFDEIIGSIPAGVEVLVVLAHSPDWITDPNNWVNGNPRRTWIDHWLIPTVTRYANVPGIVGFEIWNEPNETVLVSDVALGLEDPDNYYELLSLAAREVRTYAPGKLVVMAATTSIQQNFPNTLNYNRRLRDLGAEGATDIWNVHYYGKSFETIVTSNGVGSFLNGISIPIWVTESGETGPNRQLAYVETAWPFLREEIPGIQRFYYYEYGSTAPVDNNFGLRTTDPALPVSDLYLYLRDGTR